jgi:MinD-like ATPase involved in chromosome partitioning or flagellar assembly
MALNKIKPAKKINSKPKVIVFVSFKGGAGKSMVASAAASVTAHAYEQDVVLLDTDPQGTTTKYIGADKNVNGAAHLLCPGLGGEEEIQQLDDKLSVISGNSAFNDPSFMLNPMAYSDFIESTKEDNMCVVIDTTNAEKGYNLQLPAHATDIVVVYDTDDGTIERSNLALAVYEKQYKTKKRSSPKFHLVLNKFKNGKTQDCSIDALNQLLEHKSKHPVYTVRDAVQFIKSRKAQCPITKWDHRNSDVRNDNFVAKGPYINDIKALISAIYKG